MLNTENVCSAIRSTSDFRLRSSSGKCLTIVLMNCIKPAMKKLICGEKLERMLDLVWDVHVFGYVRWNLKKSLREFGIIL